MYKIERKNSCFNNGKKSNYISLFKILLVFLLIQSCKNSESNLIRSPELELYQNALVAAEDEFYQEAIKNFEILVNEFPNTRLGTLSHLMMGDLYYKQGKWEESDGSYRSFLLHNPRSNLTPYVLNRLIALSYERNHYGLFVKSRDYDRNMEPNRILIREYQRFYLLFPQSPYLSEVKEYYKRAMSDLAEHELHVGNFYFGIEAYHSAINRYLYLLKYYPNFPRQNHVAERLIEAYRLNQQPELAEKINKILELIHKHEKSMQISKIN